MTIGRRQAILASIACLLEGSAHSQEVAKTASLGLGAALDGLQVFPKDNPWNRHVSDLPKDKLSAAILKRIGLDKPLHPDFGTVYDGVPNGIPYVVVNGSQEKVVVRFETSGESDPGPYPIPKDAPIEGGPAGKGDRHVLVVDRDHRKLYELFSARINPLTKEWSAGSGAVFDLTSNKMRPAGWTSADAAGLPIFPGLVRYEEAAVIGVIKHAFRFTLVKTRRAYVHPARHFASTHRDIDLAPMGMRVRLKDSFPIDQFPPQARAIAQALKTYGMIVADNGSDFYLNGSPDPRWNDDDLSTLKRIKVRDFEVVAMSEVVMD